MPGARKRLQEDQRIGYAKCPYEPMRRAIAANDRYGDRRRQYETPENYKMGFCSATRHGAAILAFASGLLNAICST
jgi:hypothetical protein